MKKRFILPGLLLGILLALPANGQNPDTITITQGITGSPVSAGNDAAFVLNEWGSMVNKYWDSADYTVDTASIGPGSTFILTGSSINLTQSASDGFAGIFTGGYKSIFELPDITISGVDGGKEVTGFSYLGYNAAAGDDASIFSGEVRGGAINVTSGDTDAADTAYGARFAFWDSGYTLTKVGGLVHFGAINATSESSAVGFNAGSIVDGADIDLGAVSVTGKGTNAPDGWAVGAHFTASDATATTGTFKIDDLDVTSDNGGAWGLRFAPSGNTTDVNDNAAAVTLGTVDVSAATVSYGVEGNNISNLTLTDSFNIENTGTYTDHELYTFGVHGKTISATIDGEDVVMGAHVGFRTTGTDEGDALNLTVNEGKSLTSSFQAGNDVHIGGEGTYKIQGYNSFNGNAVITVANFDGSNLLTDSDTTIESGPDSTMSLAGNTIFSFGDVATDADMTTIMSKLSDISFTPESIDHFDFGYTTGATLDADGKLLVTRADSVQINDGFLAAYTIHNRYTAWNAVRDHFVIGTPALAGYRGQEYTEYEVQPCDPAGACDPCGTFSRSLARNAWVNYVGRSDEYRSSYRNRDWNLSTEGIQTGTDLYRTKQSQIGLLFGYEGGRMYNAADRIESDDTYIGVFGARVFRNGADVRGSFAYGWQDYNMNRWDATSGALYLSSFKGRTSESNLEIGKRFYNGAWSLRPVLGIDVYNNNLKGTKESAGAGQMTYGKDSLTQVFLRTGADLRFQARRFAVNSGLYYAYDLHNQKLESMVSGKTTQGTDFAMPLAGSRLGRELLTFNVGVDIALAKNFSVFGGYQGQSLLDSDNDAFQSVGYIGGAWKW